MIDEYESIDLARKKSYELYLALVSLQYKDQEEFRRIAPALLCDLKGIHAYGVNKDFSKGRNDSLTGIDKAIHIINKISFCFFNVATIEEANTNMEKCIDKSLKDLMKEILEKDDKKRNRKKEYEEKLKELREEYPQIGGIYND